MNLYIAYGSNLHLEQMKYRCPGATIYAKGVIENYRLVFRGSKTGSYATIIRAQGSCVPVVVWKISDRNEQSLDRYEGYPTFYYKKRVRVKLTSGARITGMAYIMFDEAKVGAPSMRYLTTVSEGYLDNNLDMRVFEEAVAYNRIEIERARTSRIAF